MKKVYVVFYGHAEEPQTVAVYADKEKAEAEVERVRKLNERYVAQGYTASAIGYEEVDFIE